MVERKAWSQNLGAIWESQELFMTHLSTKRALSSLIWFQKAGTSKTWTMRHIDWRTCQAAQLYWLIAAAIWYSISCPNLHKKFSYQHYFLKNKASRMTLKTNLMGSLQLWKMGRWIFFENTIQNKSSIILKECIRSLMCSKHVVNFD